MKYGYTFYNDNEAVTVSGCDSVYIAFRRAYLIAKDSGLRFRGWFEVRDKSILTKKQFIERFRKFRKEATP